MIPGLGLSLGGSAQSGAGDTTSGQGQGGNFGGTNYGPGSLIQTDQRGSIGASAGGANLGTILVIAVGGIIAAVLVFKFATRKN